MPPGQRREPRQQTPPLPAARPNVGSSAAAGGGPQGTRQAPAPPPAARQYQARASAAGRAREIAPASPRPAADAEDRAGPMKPREFRAPRGRRTAAGVPERNRCRARPPCDRQGPHARREPDRLRRRPKAQDRLNQRRLAGAVRSSSATISPAATAKLPMSRTVPLMPLAGRPRKLSRTRASARTSSAVPRR